MLFFFISCCRKNTFFSYITEGKTYGTPFCHCCFCALMCAAEETDTLTALWSFTALPFLSLCFQPEHLPQPTTAAVERSLHNITNWVRSLDQLNQELYRAFPLSSTPLTDPYSHIYPDVTVWLLQLAHPLVCSQSMFLGLVGHALLII